MTDSGELVAALVTEADPVADRAVFDRQWSALRAALAGPVPAVLRGWAAELAELGDALPLLGTGLRGPTYEALLWNGARCPRAAVLVTCLLAAPPEVTTDDLAAAVAAGVRVNEALAAPGPAMASVATVGCAVAAALVTSAAAPATVVDLAASLMVFSSAAAVPGDTRTDLVRAGHPVASGWLATRLLAAGFAPMPGALAATLTAAGAPSAAPPAATVSDLLDSLPTR